MRIDCIDDFSEWVLDDHSEEIEEIILREIGVVETAELEEVDKDHLKIMTERGDIVLNLEHYYVTERRRPLQNELPFNSE